MVNGTLKEKGNRTSGKSGYIIGQFETVVKEKILKNKTKKCCSNLLIRDLDFLERKRKGKEWGLERK